MTLENIALWAQRKGVDLLGTGDCLQRQWLNEIEAGTYEAEPGFLALKPEVEKAVHARLPERLRRSIRFVLSTEVNCVTGDDEMKGIHQLIYFPSLKVAREVATRMAKRWDLTEGRPTLFISELELVGRAKDFDRVHVAAPHVMNPWFSALGTIGGAVSVEEIYKEQLPNVWAIETGLTSDPAMCRRVPSLDLFGLYSCSDAHSLENMGRECTLLEIEASYDALMEAIRAGTSDKIIGTLKFPLELTRYYRNWCSNCKDSFNRWPICPRCSRPLTKGSNDRMDELKDNRESSLKKGNQPPFEALRPLSYVIAKVEGKNPDAVGVRRIAGEIVDRLGSERYVLTEASPGEFSDVTSAEMAKAIIEQRRGDVSLPFDSSEVLSWGQRGFDFFHL